jgi:hypothetical protein
MALPRTKMMTFNGDPAKFWMFMRRFDSCVGNTAVDPGAKLNCLLSSARRRQQWL